MYSDRNKSDFISLWKEVPCAGGEEGVQVKYVILIDIQNTVETINTYMFFYIMNRINYNNKEINLHRISLCAEISQYSLRFQH